MLRRTLPVDIRTTLNQLPKTLFETYEHALLAIDEEKRRYAQRLFQCLAVSIRPLRVEELADILAVHFDAGALAEFNPKWRLGDNAEEAVLSVCTNLVSVVKVDGSQVVQFSHLSVKEFLTSTHLATAGEELSPYHIIPHLAHAILAQASLGVLLKLDDHIDRDGVKKFPLASYAARHWVDHGQFENVSLTIQNAMERLFNPQKPHFSAWIWTYDMDDPWRGTMPTTNPERPQAVPLYYAILCGFRGLIEHLIDRYPGDIGVKGGSYDRPLFAALIKEDIDTTLSLLQRGVNVNFLDKRGISPLHRASQGGRIDIVQLLLEHNADVNIVNEKGDNPLLWASVVGDIGVIRLLLQWQADVNLQNKSGHSPLHGAAQSGHTDVIQFLIESGAHVDAYSVDGWTALKLASHSGHVKVAELLVQYGADVANVGCRDGGWTPLHLASREGHIKVAELLIQSGEAVSSCTDWGETPLHSASNGGHVDIAELLIQHGADLDSRDRHGWTALGFASDKGHVKLAELLIQNGADVGSRNDNGSTSLHLAALNGHLNMVKFLLECGADCNIRTTNDKKPLDLAFDNGRFEVANLLSRMTSQDGVDLTSPANNPQNQHPDTTHLPQPRGEEVVSSPDKQPSVCSASENGQIGILRSFLDRGSDVDEMG